MLKCRYSRKKQNYGEGRNLAFYGKREINYTLNIIYIFINTGCVRATVLCVNNSILQNIEYLWCISPRYAAIPVGVQKGDERRF